MLSWPVAALALEAPRPIEVRAAAAGAAPNRPSIERRVRDRAAERKILVMSNPPFPSTDENSPFGYHAKSRRIGAKGDSLELKSAANQENCCIERAELEVR